MHLISNFCNNDFRKQENYLLSAVFIITNKLTSNSNYNIIRYIYFNTDMKF